MSYKYEEIKPRIFEPDNQEKFLKVRDNVHRLLKQAGAVRMWEAMSVISGDNWTALACVDRLVELGEIVELQRDCVGQYRVFVSARE